MTLATHEFKNSIKFRTVDYFIKQHAAVCKGKFHEPANWNRSTIQKRVCSTCNSVTFLQLVPYRAKKNATPVKRIPGVKINSPVLGHELVFEGYIPRAKLGLLERDPDPHKKTKTRCIGCEVWAPSELVDKGGLCPSCRNSHMIPGELDYDDFYHDATSVEMWQQGQAHEVGSQDVWTPPIPIDTRIERHTQNDIMFMFVRHESDRDIRLAIAALHGLTFGERETMYLRAEERAEQFD